jgi:hypothetical protein
MTAAKAERPISGRSEALTLLGTLQREARLLDLICEPLDQFNDQQVGAAAREVLRDSRKTLDRLFQLAPLSESQEGDEIGVPQNWSPAQLRLIGKSSGQRGVVVHRGWRAGQCDLPKWQGGKEDALVIAPVELEVQ